MKKIIFLAALFFVLFAACAGADMITINPPSGFYEDDVTVEVTVPDGETAWYSLDGTMKNPQPVSGEIIIDHTGDFSAHTLRVWTDSGYDAEAAYVIGAGISDRFDMYVGVIDTADASLHDYDTGILVEGRVWDEYDEENPDNELTAGKHPANYNQRGDDWVRDAYVTIFDKDGNEIISQAAGLSVMGAGSSKQSQKSLKVSADEAYDPDHDDFIMDIFTAAPGENSASRTITEFNNLVFRNSGNDYNITWFRWNFISSLAKKAGFEIVQSATPCVLFLNGEYYGMTQLQPTASRKFVADSVGISDQENIQVVKNGDQKAYAEAGIEEIIAADLSVPENLAALESVMDVDQFLRYCAFQTICNNTDWPSGNIFMWRYTGQPSKNNPNTDGRWRYVIYDLDFAFDVYGKDEEVFDKLFRNDNPLRSFFRRLMENDTLRARYLANVYELLSEVFVEDEMLSLIDVLDAQINAEITEKSPIEKVRDRDHARYVNNLREEVMSRRTAVARKIGEYLSAGAPYVLSVSDPGLSATIEINGVKLLGETSGVHYSGAETVLTCHMHAGWEFSGWTVNGETVTDAELVITEEMAASGAVEITLNAENVPSGPVIWAVAYKDEEDLIEIMNPGSDPVDLTGLYISDDPEEPGKQRLPEIALEPGKSITLAAWGGDFSLSFGVKKGETVLISSDDGKVWDAVTIPKMESGDVYARYGGGEFSYYRRTDEE